MDGDGGESLCLAIDLDPFLGFDGLVKPVGPLASDHLAAGVLVDDDHFELTLLTRGDHVVAIADLDHVGPQRLLEKVGEVDVLADVEGADACLALGFGDALVGE